MFVFKQHFYGALPCQTPACCCFTESPNMILYIQVRFSYKSSVYSIHIIIYTIYQNHIGSVQHSLRDPALPDSCLMLLYGAVLACYMQLQVSLATNFQCTVYIYTVSPNYIGSVQQPLRDPALLNSCLMLLHGVILACFCTSR